jgi:hypothetical protein
LRTNFLAYIEKYPGIKGIVGLEDTTVGRLAIAANAVSPPVGVANPTPEKISTLPSILPLAEGMEVYVDGLAGAVVVSPDKEIERDRSIVMIQSRGQEPREMEATRCFITLKGPYPHPGLYRVQDDVRAARARLAQKGLTPFSIKNHTLPQVPALPSRWEEGEKASWFQQLVRFRHCCHSGEQFRVRDRDGLSVLAQAWDKGGKAVDQY